MNIVYFDLETKYLADEVGGWDYIDRMGLAVAVTYSTARGGFARYTENEVSALIDELANADLVVGFNILRFDYTVLRPYTTRDLRVLPSLDIMAELQRRLGHRVKLEMCASATLGDSKGGDGVQAVHWFRQGLIDQVARYCEQDVDIVRRLHEYGRRHKQLLVDTYTGRKVVPVSW
ncbi:MAG: ribonuclease H-like domain-containing protein [Fimbriimonadales bacterium]|nr:ribonuclease H-like domain-containing protein [Fimbriimonadales bacterium]